MNDTAAARQQRQIANALAIDPDGAFERFVLAYQDRIFAFCTGLCADRASAQEVAQDTFLRAYRALRTYEPSRIRALSLRAWLYRIALNLAKNSHRRKRFATAALEAAGRLADAADIAGDAEQAELARTVRSAVNALPAHLRAAVVLRHLDDLSYEEIAAVTGIAEGTIKSHVHRGLRRLRKDLAHVNA